MVETITKKELIERLKSLKDDDVITNELLEKLTSPDKSDAVFRGIEKVHSMDPINWDNIISDFIKGRKNITEVHKPSIGVLPNDLSHPIEVAGMGWRVLLRQQGGFLKDNHTYMFKFDSTKREEKLFQDIENMINYNKWIHTYIYSIEFMPVGAIFNPGNDPIINVRMSGITKAEYKYMKEKGDEKDKISWVDLAEAAGIDIKGPEVID